MINLHVCTRLKKNCGQGNDAVSNNKPAPTIRAEHHGNIQFHYGEQRRLTVREVARFQSFPDSFVFPVSMSAAYRQIGNAVPPTLARHLAETMRGFL